MAVFHVYSCVLCRLIFFQQVLWLEHDLTHLGLEEELIAAVSIEMFLRWSCGKLNLS